MLIVHNPRNPNHFLIPNTDLEEMEVWAQENGVQYYTEPGALGWSNLSIGTNKELVVLRWL